MLLKLLLLNHLLLLVVWVSDLLLWLNSMNETNGVVNVWEGLRLILILHILLISLVVMLLKIVLLELLPILLPLHFVKLLDAAFYGFFDLWKVDIQARVLIVNLTKIRIVLMFLSDLILQGTHVIFVLDLHILVVLHSIESWLSNHLSF